MKLDPYSTHLPILYLISRFFKFNMIHEFGVGMNSTPVLCDQEVYSVKQIVLYEDSIEWLTRVYPIVNQLSHNRASCLLATPEQMLQSYLAYGLQHRNKTLTLVDNSDEPGRRTLIKGIVSNNHFGSAGCVTVFHDAENYQDLFLGIKPILFETFLFDALLPNTLIVFGYGTKPDNFIEVCRDFNTWLKHAYSEQTGIVLPPLNEKKTWVEFLSSPGMYQNAIEASRKE